jgi:hypothetical protein
MITPEEKAAIARINGAKSSGLKTLDGREASALNALKHGLRSQHRFVSQNERKDGWERMLAVYNEAFRPATDYERKLAEGIASARWRLRRAWTLQTGLFDIEMDRWAPALEETYDTFDEGTRLASAFTALARAAVALRNPPPPQFRSARRQPQAHRNKKMPNEPIPHRSDIPKMGENDRNGG